MMKHLYQYFIKNQSNDFQPQANITRVKQIEPESKKQVHRQIEPVCFDIMEMIGKEYTIIKQMQTTKQKMSLVLDELNQIDEYGHNSNQWCYGCDCMDFHWLCEQIEEHYENYTNPYIELMYFEPSDAILPPFMIELSKAYFEKNYDLTM